MIFVGHTDVALALIAAGYNLTTINELGKTPLHLVIQFRNFYEKVKNKFERFHCFFFAYNTVQVAFRLLKNSS